MAAAVLIVEDEDSTRTKYRDAVVDSGFRTKMASATEQAIEILAQSQVDIVITDLRVPALGDRVVEANPGKLSPNGCDAVDEIRFD